ncbi:copper uptake system-associated protein [Acidovorax sp. NCPPB 3576]|uniref:copper uptake system-associated protein n=1 Tax=Acidovorax sp. NCPPB 3576 TaxID=2940488 RepID=UPI00234AC1C6|nr:copper uptake system-associated protein [Acidovorax sp. NCPPB 3576]WCM86558.1 copper uptake system-associated protein [Acidovorax sp. NCPPB 3576]
MTIIRLWPGRIAMALVLFLNALTCMAGESPDEAAIRQVILSTWNKPNAPVEVGPVVVAGGNAIAGWTQGTRGGRALMARDKAGRWSVAACGGDGLKEAKLLESTGMGEARAKQLSAALAQAESAIPAARRAQFSTFDGLVRMDAAGQHSGHEASSSRTGIDAKGAKP